MADFYHNWAKKYMLFAPIGQIRRHSQCHVTLRLPDRKTNLLQAITSLPHAGVGNRIRTAAVAREDPCANYDLKDRMSPNYERSDTVHCFLGNILTSKCERSSFHTCTTQNETIIGNNLFMTAVGARGAYDSYPICLTIRHTCKSRLAG